LSALFKLEFTFRIRSRYWPLPLVGGQTVPDR
jgi:hypothetical protein